MYSAGKVVRNSRGIAASLFNLFGGGSSNSSHSSHSSSSSSSNCGSSGDEYEIIQLTPQVSRGLDLNNYAISGYGSSGGRYGGSHTPAVSTRVVGQNVRQTGSGPISSIRQGPTRQVSGGISSYPSVSAPVIRSSVPFSSSSSYQSAPQSGCGCECCCPCGCGCGGGSSGSAGGSYSSSSSSSSSSGYGSVCTSSGCYGLGSNQPGQSQIGYVHIEHSPEIIEQVVEHHIEHPPQIIETVVEHVVEHPPQIIEHTNHVIEKVPHVMIARPGPGSHHESHSSFSHQIANEIGNVINHAVSGKVSKF